MAIYINSNVTSLISQRNLTKNTDLLSRSFERLSSGFKINRASDDAAGLALSERLRTQLKGNTQAITNSQDGVNMLQIADGGLEVITDNLQRINELTVRAANGTYATAERCSIFKEIQQRLLDITRIAKTSDYNKINLLTADFTSLVLQIGSTSGSTSVLDIAPALPNATATNLGINLNIDPMKWTSDMARSYIDSISGALSTVINARSMIGAYQNRLESALSNLTIMNENVTSSESRIRDIDIAEESSNMTRYQILQQASASILTQANQLPSIALSLLGS